ncbi:MAG: outer-membrane lipoprotein carrier protein LolA [Henriciella sp.]
MLIGFVSTIALVLAFGPQLQVLEREIVDPAPAQVETVETEAAETGLEAAAETATPEDLIESTLVEQAAEDDQDLPASEPTNENTPIEDAIGDDAGETLVEEPMTETAISEQPIATPAVTESEIEQPAPSEDAPMIETEVSEPVEPAPVRNGDVPEADWPEILEKTSAGLASAKTAKGQFVQTNTDGTVVTGSFALNRPGRMRFDYDDPTPVLIVSDGTTVAMQDTELETVDRVPIGATPLGLILSTELNVDTDIEVLSILQNEERIGIRVQDATGELEGNLTMVFDKISYDLLGWLAVDGNLQTTVVDLLDVETNVRIDPRLFRLDEDDDEEDER